jgi:hypothetical protein
MRLVASARMVFAGMDVLVALVLVHASAVTAGHTAGRTAGRTAVTQAGAPIVVEQTQQHQPHDEQLLLRPARDLSSPSSPSVPLFSSPYYLTLEGRGFVYPMRVRITSGESARSLGRPPGPSVSQPACQSVGLPVGRRA